MFRFISGILAFALTAASISVQAQNLWQIQEIVGESDEGSSTVTVVLNQEVSSQDIKIEEHGTFIQALIPNTQVLKPGEFLEGNSPLVRKIAAFQVNERTAGLRLFVAKEAARIQPAVSIDQIGSRILITIDHSKIASSVQKAQAPFEGVPAVDEVIRRTAVRGDIADPALRTHSEPSAPIGATTSQAEMGNLQQKLEWVTAGAAILFLLFSLFIKYRRRIFRSRGGNDDGPPFTMKTLATYPVAPKQRLTVVEVGGQKLLLGISPDNINYLTEIREANPQVRSQQILEHISQRPPQARMQIEKNTSFEQVHAQKASSSSSPIAPKDKKIIEPNLRGDAVRTQFSTQVKASAPTRSGASQSKKPSQTRPTQTKVKDRIEVDEPSSIEDVTNLIRRKLKDLPKI